MRIARVVHVRVHFVAAGCPDVAVVARVGQMHARGDGAAEVRRGVVRLLQRSRGTDASAGQS